MTRSALLLACLSGAAFAAGADAPEAAGPPVMTPAAEPRVPDETTLQSHRTPFEVLSERLIGVASRAVRYDWRNSHAGLGITGAQLLEQNNFGSARLGGVLRAPMAGLMVDFAVTRVFTWGSDSTNLLSLTPYRQAGRPSRVEADLNLGYPLAEAVTTPRFSFLPPTELVFFINAGLRYRFYPHELDGMSAGDAFKGFFAAKLSDKQVQNIEYLRLPGMELDRGRYDLLVGFSLDLYFQNGLFVTPRVMVALPVFSGLASSKLGFWWELTLAAGWQF